MDFGAFQTNSKTNHDGVIVDALGSAFHEDVEGVFEDLEGGNENEDAEYEGADGVDEVPLRFEVDKRV